MDHLHAKRPVRLPVVLSRGEAERVLAEMLGVPQLMATLLYGSGMRLMECCQLRVKDVNLSRRELSIRAGKGKKDRVTMVAERLLRPLEVGADRASETVVPRRIMNSREDRRLV